MSKNLVEALKMAEKEADLNFDLLETGCHGGVEVVPDQTDQSHRLPLKTLPCGLPPVLPSIHDELESFLTCPEKLPIHNFKKAQRFWPHEMCPDQLLELDVCPAQTTIQMERNPTTGKLIGYKEVFIAGQNQLEGNSLSMKRRPGPATQTVRGSTANYPFWPGGLDEPEMKLGQDELIEIDFDFENNLCTVAPGLSSGMTFEKKSCLQVEQADGAISKVISLQDIMAGDYDIELGESDSEHEEETHSQKESNEENKMTETDGLDNLVEVEEKPAKPVSVKPVTVEWAVKVDVNHPVDDFYKRIPHMAYKWPFEPDIFQKQAILHLEKHESVFVSAHTSAGKTVVAEYAIALSLKHMTRTIYTSPIKALSNQKFRDFKQTFGDVGLVTGDVQLNQTAACLIMTTEILRSMLYNGSDVIRDLEWVIFDEVHYINDSERGVVWEEVLIMLPQHVNIILLSATVPNTMEFANWVGRIKQKKIYVVSTSKRPVPLEHHLYTGNSTKTNNELFVILDPKGNFLTNGYKKAVDAKKERSSKRDQSYGAKGTRGGNPAQDKNVWISLIDMLKKKEKLPVVVFTFSRKRIEENAVNLHSVDLLTASEKSEVHIYFHKCINRLRGNDKLLPQVVQMEDHLKRGFGVHHSGILPILKEVVEMLFQRGLVKVLFATETFAMGVNMPARTVVFDTIRKHDGMNFRNLLPGEYIQMAGRAGRRGLDTTGTVIIMCKGDVPEMSDLHKMMLGKPTKLESQFRLTYTMILNLLRVEQLRVEDMMKRSFSEFHNQKDMETRRETMTHLAKQVSELQDIECYMCSIDLDKYYQSCKEYHELKQYLQTVIMSHPATMKALSPGRIVIVSNTQHCNMLGVVLKSSVASNNEKKFTVLVTSDKTQEVHEDNQQVRERGPEPVLDTELFLPTGPSVACLLTLTPNDISVITSKTIRVEPEKIINDVKKREQARFKDDPPSQSVSVPTQEMVRLTEANPSGLPGLDPVKDLHVRDISLVEQFRALQLMKEGFCKFQCIHCPNFDDHFCEIRRNMGLRDEYNHLQFLLSDQCLSLLPEYQQRINVLKALHYIDENNAVQLKSRVACEISNHELIITELVFDNVLTDLHPTDIVALLSCMVFEQKHCSEPNLAENLKQGKQVILEVAERIGKVQKECGMQMPVEDFKALFHFGLMEVVFEWARGMPFAEITDLTDVQEGIIVRSIQRLNETLQDVRNAARIIGDPILYQKMEEASTMIKRDIVFAASLYTQ